MKTVRSLRSIRAVAWAPLALLVALVATARPAAAVPIDFESLVDLEVVTTQFAAEGVVFSNARVLTDGSVGGSLNEIDFPPSSGVNVITGIADDAAIEVTLSTLAQSVSLQITTGDVARVTYYDASNVLLGESLVDANLGGNTLVTFVGSIPLVASVRIAGELSGNASLLTVDDFDADFGQGSGTVPEPSAALVMACGLAVFAGGIRRRA